MEYVRGFCKPSNDLPLWTDSILLCKLQNSTEPGMKQWGNWHWTKKKPGPQSKNSGNIHVSWQDCSFELHRNTDRQTRKSFIMWSWVQGLTRRWNPSEHHCSHCWALSSVFSIVLWSPSPHLTPSSQSQCRKTTPFSSISYPLYYWYP